MGPAASAAPVLVVDDDDAVRSLIGDHLKNEGYEVREAVTGEEALRIIETEAISLVLLDMGLPGMSGANVVRALRSRVETETLPIMILTGRGDTFPVTETLDLGADTFLSKPVDLKELAARIRARLRSQSVSVDQARRQGEAFYRTLVEQSVDGILVSGANGRYVEANAAACRMLGYSRDELLAMSSPALTDTIDPFSLEEVDRRLAEAEVGTGFVAERRFQRSDGTILPADVSYTRLPDGRLQRAIRDSTARLAAEADRARLASAVEQSSDSILIINLAGGIEYVNPAFERISGYSSAEVIGQNPRMLGSGLQWADSYGAMRERVMSGEVWSGSLVNRRRDGSLSQLEASISPMLAPDGTLTGFVGVQRDVTENVANQVALRDSQRNLAEAQRIAHIGSWERDLATGTITWSDEAYRLMGLEPGTFDGSLDAYGLMVHPDDQDRAMPSADILIQQGPTEREYRVIHADGSTRVVRERSEVIRDAEGTPVRYVGSTQDVTEQVAADTELRETLRNLAAAQRIAHIGSFEWDIATDQTRWTPELHRIFGTDPDTFSRTSAAFLELVHPADRAAVDDVDRHLLEDGAVPMFEYRIIRPDGTERLVREERELVRDPSGAPLRTFGIVEDITERAAAEEERTRLVAAIEQTADAIWMQDTGKNVTYVNPAFTRVYGYTRGEIIGRHARIVDSGRQDRAYFEAIWAAIAAGRTWSGSMVNRHKDGPLLELEAVISGTYDADGRLTGYVQVDRDVTREREVERRREREVREREAIGAALAQIDLTETAEEIAASACTWIGELPWVDSTLVIELDEFAGTILAANGAIVVAVQAGSHLPPDRAAYLLERASRGPWLEDWMPTHDTPQAVAITASGLRAAAYVPLRGPRGVIGVVGIGAHDPATQPMLLEHLPALASFASILGALLVPKLEEHRQKVAGKSVIRAILDDLAFTPYFQPIVELRTGEVVGYEALTRFTDGMRPDLRFAVAARAGLGVELELATLRAAIAASEVLPPMAYVSLNVSPTLIESGELRAILAGTSRRFTIELTEHVVVEDYPAIRRAITDLGPSVWLSVDDAGAGYSSFRHIIELVPRFVKLDIGFIREIDKDPARQALLAGMAYFAVKRKIHLIAEGIETERELVMVRSLGIGYGQGYLLGRPQDGRGPGPWPTQVSIIPPKTRRATNHAGKGALAP